MNCNARKKIDSQSQVSSKEGNGRSKSWLFNHLPSQSNGSRIQYTKDRPRIFLPVSTSNRSEHRVPVSTVTKISASFDKGLTHRSPVIKRKALFVSEIAEQERSFDSRRDAHGPDTCNFLVEKYKLKDRYDVAAIHRNVCDHCKFDSLTYNARKPFVETRLTASSESDFETSSSLRDAQKEIEMKTLSKRRKKKIIVKMPKTDDIHVEEVEILPRTVFPYTHKNK